jgi:hypothetical protein
MEVLWESLMVLEIIGCPGRDRLMNLVYAEKMMKAREFFQIGERVIWPR